MVNIKSAGLVETQFPVLLHSLPTPKEVRERADRFCRRHRLRAAAYSEVLEQINLQYHFGGKMIAAIPMQVGLLILGPNLPDPDTLEEWESEWQKKGQTIVFLNPPLWENDGAEINSPACSDLA